MAAHPLCHECDGTGWIPYTSETLDGQFEEVYGLCPNCYALCHPKGSNTRRPCPHPDAMRCGPGYYSVEHSEAIHIGERLKNAYEAIYYLKHWQRVARCRANGFLETQLSEALGKSENWLRRVEQELNQTRQDTEGSN